jgi:HlyD family secretion protein
MKITSYLKKTLENSRSRWATLTGAGVLLGLSYLFGSGHGTDTPEDTVTVLEAGRADFVVSVKESGTLEPVNQTTIRNEVNGSSRIIYLVPQGTQVKEGDLLVELDSSEQEKRLERRRLSYESRQATLAAAESRLVIVKSDAESDVRKAQLKVDFARMDMEKFESLEKDHLLREAKLSVLLAQEKLSISEQRYSNSKKLAEAGFETSSIVNRDKLSVTAGSARLEKARNTEKSTRHFDAVKRYRKLAADLVETQTELMRTKREADRRLVQAQAKLSSASASLDVAKLALTDAAIQVNASRMYAPHEGMVVYGGSSSRASRESMIEEGAVVRNRQELITIPDTSAMKIAVKIHETMASDVEVGQEAFVTLDATPDIVYKGRVSHMSLFPDRRSFWSSSKSLVYGAEITLTNAGEAINPGASGKAQIVVHYLEDTLTVPINAVTTIEGQQIVEVQVSKRKTETRPVEIGIVNERRVQVLAGIKEGDRVVVRKAG